MADLTALSTIRAQVAFNVGISTRDLTRRGTAKAVAGQAGGFLEAFGLALRQSITGRRYMATVNRDLAGGMQRAIVNAYIYRVSRQKKIKGSYRVGDPKRLSGGILRRALQAEGMVVGASGGIAMMNTEILNATAKHWARLNYGAGTAGDMFAPATVPIRVVPGGEIVAAIRSGVGPRPGFLMPKGYWVLGDAAGAGGRAPGFYPTSSQLTVPTRGIQGRHFFDAGLEYFGREFPKANVDLLNKWIIDAQTTGKGAAAKALRVNPGAAGLLKTPY